MLRTHHIFMIGESPLVREYSALCLNRKQAVTARLNRGEPAQLPKGVKRAAAPAKSVTVALELTNIAIDVKRKNLILLDRSLGSGIPIISSSLTVTVAEQSSWIEHPGRLVGIGALPSLLDGSLIEFAPSEATTDASITRAKDFAATLGKEAAVVQDSIGLVMPRILCTLANEAYFAMTEDVAAGDDIDTAMKLGTNYPAGPVERAGKIGLRSVCAVLRALHDHFGEERYRIAPSLHRAAFRNP